MDEKQIEQEAPSLCGNIPARSRLKSRKDCLTSVNPSYFPPKAVLCNDRGDQWTMKNQLRAMTVPRSHVTGYNCSKEQGKKVGLLQWRHIMCMRDGHKNTAHMLRCSLLSHHCTLDDLLFVSSIQIQVNLWYKNTHYLYHDIQTQLHLII